MALLSSLVTNTIPTPLLVVLSVFTIVVLYYGRAQWKVPDVDLPWFALDEQGLRNPDRARMQFMSSCTELLQKGLKTIKGPFQVYTGDGPRIVLPIHFADEIRNNENMRFGDSAIEGVFYDYPGFQPFGMATHHRLMPDLVRLRLNRSLDAVTPELTDEATEALNKLLGHAPDWKEVAIKPIMYRLIARLSSRVFFGPEVCNNEEWISISVNYTQDSFGAMRVLRTWNPLLRPIVHWFIPQCRRVRQARLATRRIVTPLVKAHLAAREANGGVSKKTSDVIGWINDLAKEKNTHVPMEDAQLFLAVAAMHTTTECLTFVMIDLLSVPEIIPRLQEEIVQVLKDGGFKKTSFSQMKLLDSVLKESQRLHPVSKIMMERKALAPVTLSSSFTIPQGAHTFVTTENHMNPEVYPDPEKFIPDRFLQMRESGDQAASSKSHFVTTSPDHLGFGHGWNACPGRFFASNELKIALIHLLLRYDWKIGEEGRLQEEAAGQSVWVPLRQKVMFKSRAVEPEANIS